MKILRELTNRTIEIVVVNDEEIKKLNSSYRNKDVATDVLSFPMESEYEHLPIGSVVISIDTAKKQSIEGGHSLETELQILFLHGVLHLLGYDHETDDGEMASEEEKYREIFNLPLGLIKRNS